MFKISRIVLGVVIGALAVVPGHDAYAATKKVSKQ